MVLLNLAIYLYHEEEKTFRNKKTNFKSIKRE